MFRCRNRKRIDERDFLERKLAYALVAEPSSTLEIIQPANIQAVENQRAVVVEVCHVSQVGHFVWDLCRRSRNSGSYDSAIADEPAPLRGNSEVNAGSQLTDESHIIFGVRDHVADAVVLVNAIHICLSTSGTDAGCELRMVAIHAHLGEAIQTHSFAAAVVDDASELPTHQVVGYVSVVVDIVVSVTEGSIGPARAVS